MNIIIFASFNLMKLMVCWNWVEYHQLYFDEIFRLEKVLIVQPQQPQRKDLMLKCYKYHSRGSPVWIKYEILQFNTTFFLECWAEFELKIFSLVFYSRATMLEWESTGNKYYFSMGPWSETHLGEARPGPSPLLLVLVPGSHHVLCQPPLTGE